MAKDPFIWTKIITYSRCVMHFIDEAWILIYFLELASIGFVLVKKTLVEITSMYYLSGCLIGCLLLHGIIKENRQTILAYVILGGITLGIRHAFQLCQAFWILLEDHGIIAILWSLACCIYFAFEWLMVYFVVKFRRTLQEDAIFLPQQDTRL